MKYPRLCWLAGTVLLYACCSVRCDDDITSNPVDPTLDGLQSYAPDQDYMITQAVTAITKANLELEDEGPDVLLVLDPNGALCWEGVDLDAFTNATLLHWLYQQHDVLTSNDRETIGEPVQMPAGLHNSAPTFKEHIEQAWSVNASYIELPSALLSLFQMTMLADSDSLHSQTDRLPSRLPPARLKLTSIDSFWMSVETSAATGRPLPANANYSNSLQSSEPHLPSLTNTIIILPRIATMIRPVTKHHKRRAASHLWTDTATWNRELLLDMLAKFLDITGAKTIPDLSEYRILPDKVALQQMYQSYHEADPETHTPPIPTTQVRLPLPPARLEELCYSGLDATEDERNSVVHSLLQALYQLESWVAIGSEVRNVIEGGGGDWMGQYMLKREFSECSFHVFGIVVPDLRNTPAAGHQQSAPDCSEEVCQNLHNTPTSSSSELDLEYINDGGGTFVSSPQVQQPVGSADALSTGSAKAANEAVNADQHAINSDADPRTPGSAEGSCGRKEQPTSRAMTVMHKAQALIWPLVPQRIAHLRPFARLLGMGNHTTTTSSSSSCNSRGDTTQQAMCSNVDIQAECGNRKELDKVKPADELLYCSTASENVMFAQAGTVGSPLTAESNAASMPDIMPDPQTGDAVVSDILIPTGHDSSAAADCDHMAEPHVPHGSEYDFTGWTIPAELVSLLEVTADRILKESCGEGWLLQPRIADMTRLEYRVYMLSGAQAGNSSSEHSMVVYTPCILDPVEGISTVNLTLPEGLFCSDVMVDPSTDLTNIDQGDFTQLTPWRSQETYDLIVKAGHDGAKALVNSPEGYLLNTVQNVFVRVDIVLATHWLTNDEVALIPMINEIDWLNSAGMLAAFWKEPAALYDLEGIHDDHMDGFFHYLMQKSPGYKIAKALYTEVLRVWKASAR